MRMHSGLLCIAQNPKTDLALGRKVYELWEKLDKFGALLHKEKP